MALSHISDPDPAIVSARGLLWSRAGQWLFGLLAAYAFAALILWFARADLRLVVGAMPWWTIPACVAMASVGYAVRVGRWLLLARIAGLRVSKAGLVSVYLGGFMMNLTPARIGEMWRSWILWHGWGVRIRRSLPLVICDRLLDLTALLLFAVLGLGLGSGFHWPAATCLIAAAMLFALIFLPGWARRAIKIIWAMIGRPQRRLFAAMLSVCSNAALMLRPVRFLGLLSLSLIAWSMEAVALHLLMPTVGGELPLRAAAAALGLAGMAGSITPLPGGIGGQELTMAFLIGRIGGGGNSAASAMAIVAVMRIGTLWYSTLLGLPFFVYLSRRHPRERQARTKASDKVCRGQD